MNKKTYIKKPISVTAIQFTSENILDVYDWVGDELKRPLSEDKTFVYIETLEGTKKAVIGDYIVKEPPGWFSIWEHSIFLKTFDEIE